jgi:hypothetical protein
MSVHRSFKLLDLAGEPVPAAVVRLDGTDNYIVVLRRALPADMLPTTLKAALELAPLPLHEISEIAEKLAGTCGAPAFQIAAVVNLTTARIIGINAD